MNDLLPAIATILAEEEQKAKPKRKKKIVQDKPLYLVPSGQVIPPLFSSAEIGNVDSSTVAVTFDQNVTAANYATGVTIKVNAVAATISSATRQTDHAVVYYVLSAPAANGDVVTWEYTGGVILAEDDNTPLGTVTAQSVTNNIVDFGAVLRADCVAYWTLDEASGTRADATGNGHGAAPTNNPSSVAGKVGDAVHLDRASSQILTVTDHADLRITGGNIYIAGWVKPLSQSSPSFGYTFLGKIGLPYIYEYEIYYFRNDQTLEDQLSFFIQTLSDGRNINSDAITIGQWYFIEAYYRASDREMGFAINGGAFSTTTLLNDPDYVTDPMVFGSDTLSAPDWDADSHQDEFAIFRPAVVPYNAATRAYLYNSGNGRTLYP